MIFAGYACCFVLLNVCDLEEGFVCTRMQNLFFFLSLKLLNVKCSLHSHNPADWFLLLFICSFGVGFELKLAQ